jgi:hypothetical protein
MRVSHIIVTIVAFGPRRSARRSAAVTFAPVDVPQNNPSSLATRNAMALASLVDTRSISAMLLYHSTMARRTQLLHHRSYASQTRPAARENCTFGRLDRHKADAVTTVSAEVLRGAPRRHADVPQLCSNASILPPVCSQISSASLA